MVLMNWGSTADGNTGTMYFPCAYTTLSCSIAVMVGVGSAQYLAMTESTPERVSVWKSVNWGWAYVSIGY